jgi:hypothetical protein
MKIDTSDFGVFHVKVSHDEANGWLMGEKPELDDVNSAIDEATSRAADLGSAFVLIEITSTIRQGQ